MNNDDPFFLDDRSGVPNAAKTIKGLSSLIPKLESTPMIMSSSGTPENPKLDMNAPYFINARRPVVFTKKFTKGKDFCFFILANSFKQTFSSHAMVGWWRSGTLILFDPNGDFWTPEPETVYNGYGYFLAPRQRNLKNPLYNTLLSHFNLPNMKVYSGTPIPCPKESQRSCIYRALMFVVAIHKSNDPEEVIRYTSKMAKSEFSTIKEIADIANFYEAFKNKSVVDSFNKLLKSIQMNNKSNNVKYT